MERKVGGYHQEDEMMPQNVLVVTGLSEKMLKNEKTAIYNLLTTAGSAGYPHLS